MRRNEATEVVLGSAINGERLSPRAITRAKPTSLSGPEPLTGPHEHSLMLRDATLSRKAGDI